jgi:2-amino-4-hydroxy-6-hydroxymethyldihydropteridine diphosphokinase
MDQRVFLGLGGNRGDTAKVIRDACAVLSSFLSGPRLSSLYCSRARYYENQPDFVNAVIVGYTSLNPRELLDAIHRVESDFGRDRAKEISKGPRSLDIDILLYGDSIIAESDLIVPHANLKERKFCLIPLLELDANLRDPVSGDTYMSYLSALSPQGIYLLESSVYDQLYI